MLILVLRVLSIKDDDLSKFLQELYDLHTGSEGIGWMPLGECLKRMIGFLESEGLITDTTYSARKSDADIRRKEMEADPRIKKFRSAFYGK